MEILYTAERVDGSLVVRLSIKNQKKALYLETLKAAASLSDQEALLLLIKIQKAATRNSPTATFEKIVVPKSYDQEVLKLLAKTGRLQSSLRTTKQELAPLTLLPKLYLTDAHGMCAKLFMDYSIEEVDIHDFSPTVAGRARLKKEESSLEADLIEAGYIRKSMASSDYFCPLEKVQEVLRLLLQVGWQVMDMRSRKVRLQTGLHMQIREEAGRICVEASAQFGEQKALFAAKQKLWMELSDGSVGLLEKPFELDGEWQGQKLFVRHSQIGSLLPFTESAHWQADLHKLALELKNGSAGEDALTGEDFRGKLLAFQQKGVNFLSLLHRFGLGALLADEMGLGKTVQVLAFISRLPLDAEVLIVAPTSLLFNWKAEIQKFLPKREHISLISYAQLRIKEIDQVYDTIVLDESSAIKTSSTQTAHCAYRLKARFRICLNGTPIENREQELLSQFQFLMPDLIERQKLKQMARPFILRRRKEEVALDLPEKIEQIVWVDPAEDQYALYESYKAKAADEKEQVLEKILRLRQICCDPRVLGEDVSSGKLQRLYADLQEALSEGRKVLVFSQFTSVLQGILKDFPESLYLDGSTSAEKRGERVRRFQEESKASVFLLSLKAGGVGLNLTAADYVFLVDPWWNNAVEEQAIDRAHRIGRRKTVIARRYLTVGTIEEKMLQLKERKQLAAQDLLAVSDAALSASDLSFLLE